MEGCKAMHYCWTIAPIDRNPVYSLYRSDLPALLQPCRVEEEEEEEEEDTQNVEIQCENGVVSGNNALQYTHC